MDVGLHELTDTWDDANQTFNAIRLDITDAESAADSAIMELLVNSGSMLKLGKEGEMAIARAVGQWGVTPPVNQPAAPQTLTELLTVLRNYGLIDGSNTDFDAELVRNELNVESAFMVTLTETTSTYMYFGGTLGTDWKINRYEIDAPDKYSATETNNGAYDNLTDAWTNRATLDYALSAA